MEFRHNSRQNYIQYRSLYFQKEINLRNDIFGISDQDITFEKVQELAISMKENRKCLFKKVEEIIELGTLQNWALKFAQDSVKEFIDCVDRNGYKEIGRYEEDICNKVNLLSEIQILFTKERYRNSPSSDTTILQELLLKPKYNLFEVVMYSNNWKVNYITQKYVYSLTKSSNYFESSETNKVYNVIKNYSQYLNAFLKVMKQSNVFLTLGHFLPEYFDRDVTEQTLKKWNFDYENSWRSKINKKEESDYTDFIIKGYLKQSNNKSLNNEIISSQKLEEIVIKKLGLVKDNFDDIINLALAFFFTHQSYYDGYELDYSSNYKQDQVYVILHSIYSIKTEAFKEKEKFFIDFFIPEILSTNINCYGTNHFCSSTDFKFVQRFIDNILKPYNKLNEIEYVYDIIEGLKAVIYSNESSQTVFDVLDQENNNSTDIISQAKKLLEFFIENIIDNSINQNEYSNVLLVSCLIGQDFTRPKIIKLLIHLFELPNRYESLDKLNVQHTLSSGKFSNNTLCENIYKEVAQSKMENLINYLHLHYIEKQCPYGNFFVKQMAIVFSQINEYNNFSVDIALKLLAIYRRYINDQTNSVFINQGSFFEIINRVALKLQKEPTYQKEYEECGVLFMRWSFYLFSMQYFDQITFGFNLETQFATYFEKYFLQEFKEFFEADKKLVIQQHSSYNPSNYCLSRALQNFLILKNNILSHALIYFYGNYYYYFKISIQQPIKITKETFQSMLRYDISNISPFCLINKNMISHLSLMSYFNIKSCELYDESGQKLENCNYISAYLEIFEQFLKDNMQVLQKQAKNMRSLPMERSQRNILNHLSKLINSEQDYEELAICKRYQYLIKLGQGFFSHFDSYDLTNCRYVFSQEVVSRIVNQIMSIYDFKLFCSCIGEQNYEVLKNCSQQESVDYLKLFQKGKLSKLFQSGTQKQNKSYELDVFEQIPFPFIKKLLYYCQEQAFYPDIVNSFISNLINQSYIQSNLHDEENVTFQEFFKQSAYFNIVIKLINSKIKSTIHQAQLQVDEHNQLKRKNKEKKDIQSEFQSKLFYISNIDILLKDQIAYQEFVLKILKKEKIQIFIDQRAKINDFHNLFIEFLDSFIKSSFSMTATLLSLVHSQNPNYIRQNNSIQLLNTLINNTYIIQITQLNNGGDWNSFSSTSQTLEFLNSFSYTIDSFSTAGMDIDLLIKEAQILYTQFGKIISENLSRVLNDTGYEVDMLNDFMKYIIQIDFSLQKALRKQELREICKKELQQEEEEQKKAKVESEEEQKSQVKENKNEQNEEEIPTEKKEEFCVENKTEEIEPNKDEEGKKNKEEKDKKQEDKEQKEKKINERIEERFKEMEEKEQENDKKNKKEIFVIIAKKIALFLNDVFYKDALNQNKTYSINKDVQAILNLPNPTNPIQTVGLKEFFNLCFTKLNTVNSINVKYIHQHLKRMIIFIGKYFDCLNDFSQQIPYLKATKEGSKLYTKYYDNEEEEQEEYEELLLFESFTDFYDLLCLKFDILKKSQQDFFTLNDVYEVLRDTASILRQFSLTTQEIQQFYDKCLDISQFIYDLKTKYKKEGYQIEMSSEYFSVLERLTEKLFTTLKALNNLVPNIRLEAIESLIQNYLEFRYYQGNTFEQIKQSILYFINVVFIAKGGANFKHFLRKCIAQDIITQNFEIQQNNTNQKESKNIQDEEKNKKSNKKKDESDEDDKSLSNNSIVPKSKPKKDRNLSESNLSSNEEEDDDDDSQSSDSKSNASDEDISILFEVQSLSGDYEVEKISQDELKKNKSYLVDDQVKETIQYNTKKQKRLKDLDQDDSESKQSAEKKDKDSDEDDEEEKDKSSSDDNDEKSKSESGDDEDESKSGSQSDEDEDKDEEEEEDEDENDSKSSSSSSSSDDEKSSSSKDDEKKKKKNETYKDELQKKKDKEEKKKKKKELIIQKNLENLDKIRITLPQIKKKILDKYSIMSQCYSQVLYEVINEFFEVSKIQIITPAIKESKNEEKVDKDNKQSDKKNKVDIEKKDQIDSENLEKNKETEQKITENAQQQDNQQAGQEANNTQDIHQEILKEKVKDEDNDNKSQTNKEEAKDIENKDNREDKDEDSWEDEECDNDANENEDDENKGEDQDQPGDEKDSDSDKGEISEKKQDVQSSPKQTQDKKDENESSEDDENEETKSKSSKKEDKENKIKRVVIYKLRNPDEVKKLYENRNKIVKMSYKQFEFVQNIIDIFVQKINNINKQLENINQSIQYKYFPDIEKTELDYIDLESIQNYLISLIQNYQNLILPHIDEFKVNNIQKEQHDTLCLFDENKSKTNFIDYLIHITMITNYHSQDILNYIVFSSFQFKDQDYKLILRQIFLKTLSILKQALEQPDFFVNMKINLAFDGILNFFKNIMNNIEEKKVEDGLLVLSLFQKTINKAYKIKELEQLFYLEIFNLYEKAYDFIIKSIYGDNLDIDKEIEFVSQNFFSYFQKENIQKSLEVSKFDADKIVSSIEVDGCHKKLFDYEWEFEEESEFYKYQKVDTSSSFNIFKEVKNNYFLYLIIKDQQSFKMKSPPKDFQKNSLSAFAEYFEIFKKITEENKNTVSCSQFKNFDQIKYLKELYTNSKIEIKPNNIYFYQMNKYLLSQRQIKEEVEKEQQKQNSEQDQETEKISQEIKQQITYLDESIEKQIQEEYEKSFKKLEIKEQQQNSSEINQTKQEDGQQNKDEKEVNYQSKAVTNADEKEYVCPSAYGFESNDLKRFNIDRDLYISLSPSERETLLESKKKEFEKKEKDKKLKVIREREKIQLNSIFNKDDYEQSKKDFQTYLKSKEFNKTVKNLEKEDQRLILLSQDTEYLKLLDNQMRMKAQNFLKKQKIQKKKISKSQQKGEEQSQILKELKKIMKVTEQGSQKQKEKELLERINKSLQVPQIDEDVALKLIICQVTGTNDYSLFKEYYSNITERAFINPFNYLRILGLLMLIISKVAKKSQFNIEWIDKQLFNPSQAFLDTNKKIKGDTEEEKNNYYRNKILEDCADLLEDMLINKKYGLIILSFEDLLFGKSFEQLEVVVDKSKNLSKLKPQVFEYNILNENNLDLSVKQYENLDFSIQFDIFNSHKSEVFSSINEFVLAVFNLCGDKKKIGVHNQSNINTYYGQKYIEFIDSSSNRLIEKVLDLFCSVSQKIQYTTLKISADKDKIKNDIFKDQNQSQSLTIVNVKQQMIIKNNIKKNTKPVFEQIFKYITLYSVNIEDYSCLHKLLKQELSNYDTFISFSDQVLSEYGVQMKRVIDDVLPALRQYQHYLKSKHNKDNLYEEVLDEDGNDVHSNLKEPITQLLSNLYSFLQDYSHRYYKNLKFIISCIDNLTESRMLHYLEEFESRKSKDGEQQSIIWWNEREQFEKQALYDEIKVNWMEETKPLSQFYVEFFEFVHICLKLQLVNENNMPSYYSDFEVFLKSFLRIYNTFYKDSKQKDDSFDQEEIILNEDEIQMPVLKRIQTFTPNEIFDGEDDNQQSLTELKNVKKYSTMLHKNYNSISVSDLYEALRTKFTPLINKYMNNRKNNMWVFLMSELNQGKMSIENKICYVRAISKKENKKRAGSQEYYEMSCTIDREEIWYSIYKFMSGLPPSSLVTEQFEITFKDENGIDAGGLSREFYTVVLKDFLDPYKGFFCPSSNGISTQPSPYSNIIPDHLLHFKYAGRLIAKSILDNFVCEIDLTKSFLKQILGQELYINDLEDIDPDLAKNLMWILDGDVSNLYLDFTYTHNDFGRQQIIELKPNGSHIEVNEENKKEYVKLLAQYRMVKQIEPQIKAFQLGFYEVIPYKAIKIFTVRELGFKLSGEKKIDLEDLKSNLNYSTYTKDSDQIKWLFEILEEYNEEQRAGFLFFVTGSFRVPFGGFSNYKLSISKLNDTQSLPVAHTCSKEMELPIYETKEIMKEKLEIAFTEGVKGFYIG